MYIELELIKASELGGLYRMMLSALFCIIELCPYQLFLFLVVCGKVLIMSSLGCETGLCVLGF